MNVCSLKTKRGLKVDVAVLTRPALELSALLANGSSRLAFRRCVSGRWCFTGHLAFAKVANNALTPVVQSEMLPNFRGLWSNCMVDFSHVKKKKKREAKLHWMHLRCASVPNLISAALHYYTICAHPFVAQLRQRVTQMFFPFTTASF